MSSGKPSANEDSEPRKILSELTLCLNCHILTTMWHYYGEAAATGAWRCVQCKKEYPFRWWKIKPRKGTKKKDE